MKQELTLGGDWQDEIVTWARAGYATKGALYCVLGALSVHAAFSGAAATGSEGAVGTIAQQPLGTLLLILVAIGLAGYAAWRFVQAAIDPEHEGTGAKAVATRIGYAASGVVHTALTVAVVQMIVGASSGGSKQTLLAVVMESPLGQLAVALAGLCFIGAGVVQLVRAKTRAFSEELEVGKMSRRVRKLASASGRVGLAARGIVFSIMGAYLVKAGLQANPNEVRGVGGALQEIAAQTFGSVSLAVVAAGLFLYGIFQFVQARYRRIPSS